MNHSRASALFVVALACGCTSEVVDAETPSTDGGELDVTSDTIAADTATDDVVIADTSGVDTKPADTFIMETAPVDAGPSSTRLTARPKGSTDAPSGFYEYLPPVPSGTKSPLLIFRHGVGENGNGASELSKVLAHGPPKLIKNDTWPSSRPFIVLSPQHAGSGCPTPTEVKAFLDWAIAHYPVDATRLYMTGLSCGAIGTWDYLRVNAATTPIAAFVLVCGDGKSAWDTNKCALGRVAIWGLHGDDDPTVAVDGTKYPMNNLIACPKPPRRDAKITLYPGVGHDSWTRTYDLTAGNDIYAWMLANGL